VAVLITCETSGSAWLEPGNRETRLDGFETGAVDSVAGWAAERLAETFSTACLRHRYRLDLVDVSRSVGHRHLFGPQTRRWSEADKQAVLTAVYHPYRNRVASAIETILQQFTFVIHLSVRTFEPWHRGKPRRTDVGLLYDPSRSNEAALCMDWIDELYHHFIDLKVRRNYPRRGTVDSLTSAMRTRFADEVYLGIEVWLNRAWVSRRGRLRDEAFAQFAAALGGVVGLPVAEAA
jgi:predicted N-formylglutamate amidohydrolase